jgi:rhamnulokinase
MSAPQFLAIDLGASSGRALLGTLEDGRMHMEEVHRFNTPLIDEGDRLRWDLNDLEQEVLAGLRMGIEAATDLRSCAVDSWAVDYVPLNEDGEPLRNPYCYRDPRTHEVMEEVLTPELRREIYDTTGIQFLPINTLFQVLSDHRLEPDLVDRTALRLPIADYFHYRLSGRPVVEQSMASTTQLLNVRTGNWARGLMERFGIDPETWPEVVVPATELGPLRSLSGAEGLDREGVRVIAGCTHDTACAVAATPARAQGQPWAYLSCGTWSLLGVERKTPILSDAARESSFTNEIGLGGTVRFLKNLTGLWVQQECERVWKAEGQEFDYDTLQEEASAAGSIGTIDLDDPRFLKRGRMPTKIENYCRERQQPVPSSRGEYVRLILESLAVDYQTKLEKLENIQEGQIGIIHLVGGGARNELLCQWTADETGRRVVAGPAEATALGNLLIQARTMGALSPDTSIRNVVRASARLRVHDPATTSALRD